MRSKRTVLLVELGPGESFTLPPGAKLLAVEPSVSLTTGQPQNRRLILIDTAPPKLAPARPGEAT